MGRLQGMRAAASPSLTAFPSPVEVDLGARPARPLVPHLPEVLLAAVWQHAALGQKAQPDGLGLLVRRQALRGSGVGGGWGGKGEATPSHPGQSWGALQGRSAAHANRPSTFPTISPTTSPIANQPSQPPSHLRGVALEVGGVQALGRQLVPLRGWVGGSGARSQGACGPARPSKAPTRNRRHCPPPFLLSARSATAAHHRPQLVASTLSQSPSIHASASYHHHSNSTMRVAAASPR
jgi:hypothetical protein